MVLLSCMADGIAVVAITLAPFELAAAVLIGHARLAFDKRIDLGGVPHGNRIAEFEGFRKTALTDPAPNSRRADWNFSGLALGRDKLGDADNTL
jgi:hypothetical protein